MQTRGTPFPCPTCKVVTAADVIDSRVVDGGRRRRRKCQQCGNRFTTREQVRDDDYQEQRLSAEMLEAWPPATWPALIALAKALAAPPPVDYERVALRGTMTRVIRFIDAVSVGAGSKPTADLMSIKNVLEAALGKNL